MEDFGSVESRARQHQKGLRQKLRVALKAKGFTIRFRTDELRDGTLVVMTRSPANLPIQEFDGRRVRMIVAPPNSR